MKKILSKFDFLVYILPFLPFLFFPVLNSHFFHLDFKTAFAFFSYYILVFLLGLAVYPMMSYLFPRLPDKAYGASRVLGLVLFAYILWSVCAFFDFPLMHWGAIAVLIFLSFIFILVILMRDDALLFVKHKKDMLIVETLFSVSFFLFLFQFSFHPEAFGGEKSMDFSLLSYFTRLDYLPPRDPWAHDSILRYYYWGYFLFAQLLKGAGLAPKVGYLVAMATLPALMICSLYSLVLSVVRSRLFAVWASLTLVFSCNYQSLLNLFTKNTWDFAYFWSATRVFKNDLFAEFPSWSFTFLDLHPHVMAYPFVILCLLFIWRFITEPKKIDWIFCLLGGLCFGLLTVTNLWDYLILSFFLGLITLFSFKKRILPALILGFFSILFYLPILIRMFVGREGGMGMSLERETFNGITQFFRHQGQWWIFIFAILLISLITLAIKRRNPLKLRLELGTKSFLYLFLLSFILILFSNHFILIDKINSIFKINTPVWVLMGIATFFLMRRFLKLRSWWKVAFFTPFVLASFILIAGSVVNVMALASFKREGWVRPELDVSAFVKSDSPSLYAAIEKMNAEIMGPIGFLEPYGRTYDFEGNRLTIFTGLSSYLIWPGQHVNQRGLSWVSIEERKKEIDAIYANLSPLSTCLFLAQMKIDYVAWFKLEEAKIPCLKTWFQAEDFKILKRE